MKTEDFSNVSTCEDWRSEGNVKIEDQKEMCRLSVNVVIVNAKNTISTLAG